MHYHAKAALTITQRAQVRELHQQGTSQAALARRFGVHRRTIQRWLGRTDLTDRSSAPKQHGRQSVTDAYRQAVLAERQQHPTHGPKRIALDLRQRFASANAVTVWRILKAAGLSQRAPKKTDSPTTPSRATSSAT
jgi:transposase